MYQKVITITLLSLSGLYANSLMDNQLNQGLNNLTNDYNKVETKQLNKTNASVNSKLNILINNFEESKRAKFHNKKSQELDIYFRENIKIIDNRYVEKTPAGWKRFKIINTEDYK